MKTNTYYVKKNGLRRLYLYGFHPMKDFVAVGSGVEDDLCYIPFLEFFSNYDPEGNLDE